MRGRSWGVLREEALGGSVISGIEGEEVVWRRDGTRDREDGDVHAGVGVDEMVERGVEKGGGELEDGRVWERTRIGREDSTERAIVRLWYASNWSNASLIPL